MTPSVDIVRNSLRSFTAAAMPLSMGTIVTPLTRQVSRTFRAYGGAAEYIACQEAHAILSGPAETGKTIALLNLVDSLCWKHPGLSAVLVRNVRADMNATVIESWEKKVIFMKDGVAPGGITKHGGESPEFYRYPNGSKIWVAGLDRPGKALSSERDLIAVNQCEEISKEAWETLATRTTGRAGILSPGLLRGDCNPGPSTHWILQKNQAKTLKLTHSKHEDNPTLFDQETGALTIQGKITIQLLDSLTGVRHKRLRLGLWVAAEGIVYETFDKSRHIVDAPYSKIVRRVGGVDWGFTNPGVFQVWAIDSDGRMYREFEIYQSGKLVEDWWVAQILQVMKAYPLTVEGEEGPAIDAIACDPSEPAYIKALTDAGIPAVPAWNSVAPGVQNVESRLRIQPDSRPRLMLLKGKRADTDPVLRANHKPTCLEDEVEVYSWPKDKADKPKKENPVPENDHACDAMRYACALVDNLGNKEKKFQWAA